MQRRAVPFVWFTRFVLVFAILANLRGIAQAQLTPAQLRSLALGHTNSLTTVKTPDSSNFKKFVQDRKALLVLGKALFWDQQLGSDKQSCATCHYHAGADARSLNQLNPGFRDQNFPGGDTQFTPPFGPNYQLTTTDFPFHDPNGAHDTNDVTSSMGVFNAAFTGLPSTPGGTDQ